MGRHIFKTQKKGVLKMNKVAVAKTILTVMPLVDEFKERCLRVNLSCAENSMFDCYEGRAMERVVDRIATANVIHNLRVRVMEYLEKLPKDEESLLRFYFMEGRATKEIAEKIGKTQRTVFRRIDKAVEKFAKNLEKIGINTFTFRELVENNRLVAEIYLREISR
jgi:RNA polymerase sigma factor (sigma-70 family)